VSVSAEPERFVIFLGKVGRGDILAGESNCEPLAAIVASLEVISEANSASSKTLSLNGDMLVVHKPLTAMETVADLLNASAAS
jgi:hypothetical protein